MSRVFKAMQRLKHEPEDVSSEYDKKVRAILLHPDTLDLSSEFETKDPPSSDAVEESVVGESVVEESIATESVVEEAPIVVEEAPVKSQPSPICESFRTLTIRVAEKSPLIPFERNAKAGEAYRLIRTKIVRRLPSPAMIVFSSADCGDGKTTSAVNVSAALALRPETRVLLVDADMRRGDIASLLELPRTSGLAEVLSGKATLEETVIRAKQYPNLHILCGGERMKNPAELLDSPAWPQLAAELRKRFTHIVVDAVPVGSVADYDLIESVTDGVVFVARPDHTNRLRCMTALQSVPKERLVGVLLNRLPEALLSAPYYRYYVATAPQK